jgi:acetyl-CoA synthetase
MNRRSENPRDRVAELLSLYSHPRASAADLLCDRHDPAAVACTIVAQDLSSTDLTYGALRAESERLCAAMAALGLRPGDRIATLMGKSRAYIVTVMAIWRLGGVHVPLFTAFAPPAISLRLTASACRLVVCDAEQWPKLQAIETTAAKLSWTTITTGASDADAIGYHDLLAGAPVVSCPAVSMGGDAPIVQIFTSGTTGAPKAVLVPLRAVAAFRLYMEYGLGVRDEDVYWNAADPGWAYGLYFAVIAPLACGVRSILLEGGFSAERTFGLLARFGVTNFAAAPTVFRALRASGLNPPAALELRCASSAGEPLTPEVNEWAESALGVCVHDHYGQTETGMLVNNHHHASLRRPLKRGSMGQAMPGYKVVILDSHTEELAPRGETGRVAIDLCESALSWFHGYVDDAARSAERFRGDGRFYVTGDSGRMDEDDYVYFSSRDDDVIIMAGYRIGPFEVESVLALHPAVSECAVVAVPDAVRGEVLEAVIVLRNGCASSDHLTLELQDWVKHRYAAHAYPRRVHYRHNLPKTPSGKLQRFMIREQLREGTGA